MLPASRRAFRRPGVVSAGWYAGRSPDGWRTEALGIATLNLPVRGTYEREVGGVRRLIDPTRCVWFAADDRSRTRNAGPGLSEGLYLQVAEPLLAEIADALPGGAPPSTDTPAGPEVVRGAWEALEHVATLPPADAEDRVVELFLALLAPLLPPVSANRAIREVQAWLSEDPAGAPGPTGLAASLGVSRFALCRQFRAATGQSIVGYREDLRLVAAVRRLLAGESDLARLAAELGFSSHSHFTLRFRRRVGCAPGQVRDRRGLPHGDDSGRRARG